MTYRSRIADTELASLLEASGAVLVEGPKACGKTETAMKIARSSVRLDVDVEARVAANIDPRVILPGDQPRLVDEWQLVPEIWGHVRRAVDDAGGRPGQFILAGSAVPPDDATRHSGAMRFTRLRMRPLSLYESGHSSGEIPLAGLLAGRDPVGASSLTVQEIAERIAVGGWPGLLGHTAAKALPLLRGYLDEARRTDLPRVDGVRRDPENVARVLFSLARHTATEASARTIAADVGGADGPIKNETVGDYVKALSRLMIVEDLPAWSPTLRSRTELRQTVTRHLVDPSLAVAALDTRPERLVRDPNTLGLLFESLVVRDLRIYAQLHDGNIFHYRDHNDLEADAVIQLRDGTWAAIEVKLGPKLVDDAAANLLKLAKKIDVDKHGAPAFLAVITGWGYAHRRPDGVLVIPIGALGP